MAAHSTNGGSAVERCDNCCTAAKSLYFEMKISGAENKRG